MRGDKLRKTRSIHTQLLSTVNLTLGVAIIVLLGLRYDREMERAVIEKRANLDDEAIAIHAAAHHLAREHSLATVQEYIDSVCRQMCLSRSPRHYIVVQLDGRPISTGPPETNSDELLTAMATATKSANHHGAYRDDTLVVGTHSSDGIDVYTSESLTAIRRTVRRDVLLQLGVIAVLGVVAAVIVNLLLVKVVSTPLRGLVRTVEQIGAGQYGTETSLSGSREMQQIATAINSMSRSLSEHEQERHRRLQTACEIQNHLLPNGKTIPGLLTAHLFEPADEVAGDYYDYLPLSDGTWLICIADVTGHGVPAAMGAAMLKMLLMVASEREEIDPVSILRFINRRFSESTLPEHFASMFLARWHPLERRLDYASAGHEPPLLLTHSSKLASLSSTGLLLGVDASADWSQRTIMLAPGDRFLIFSDGAIESRSDAGELFGRVRLSAWFSRYADAEPSDTIVRLADELINHRDQRPADDDLTLLMLEVCDSDFTNAIENQHACTDAA